jgi:hypothetical protein
VSLEWRDAIARSWVGNALDCVCHSSILPYRLALVLRP